MLVSTDDPSVKIMYRVAEYLKQYQFVHSMFFQIIVPDPRKNGIYPVQPTLPVVHQYREHSSLNGDQGNLTNPLPLDSHAVETICSYLHHLSA